MLMICIFPVVLVSFIERQLNRAILRLCSWADQNGFHFASSKTVGVHFSRLSRLFPVPALSLYQQPIPFQTEARFLGLIFDSKLSFIPHIRHLRKTCFQALNVLRILASTFWGADCALLLQIYRAVVRFKLEYGSIVYGSARPALKHLDPLQNQGLRLRTGAFHAFPASSLAVFAQEPPLALRRQQLALLYASRLASMPQHPNFHTPFHPRYRWLFVRYPSNLPTFGLRLQLKAACRYCCVPSLVPSALTACGSFHSFPHFSWFS